MHIRKIKLTIALFLLLGLTACGASTSSEQASASDSAQAGEVDLDGNVLIAYFTMPEKGGTDAVAGSSRVIEDDEIIGNTELVATTIRGEIDAELHQIEAVQEYPADHDELVDFVEEEMSENARPELTSEIEDLDKYDTIFIGYPIWYNDLPTPMYTFLESNDFSEKTIIPFSTHGGSSMSGTVETIESLQPDASVYSNGLTISRSEVPDSRQQIIDWVNSL